MNFVIATKNKGKLREFSRMLTPLGHTVQSAAQAGFYGVVPETGETFAENARLKARTVFDALEGEYAVVADDSGLCVDALAGAPGVYSARYAGEGASDEDRWKKLLEELDGLLWNRRTARFVCAIAVCLPGREPVCVQGTCEGHIGLSPLGEDGFGYDPVFYLDETTSFATLSGAEKDKISHRGEAMRKLTEQLRRTL